MFAKLLRLTYAGVALKGLLTALAPRQVLGLVFRTWSVGLKNTDQLEPREWYVTAVRATGVGLLAAGGVGLLLSSGGDDSADDGATVEDDAGDGEGPSGQPDDEGPSARTDDDGVEPIDVSPDE